MLGGAEPYEVGSGVSHPDRRDVPVVRASQNAVVDAP